MKNVIIAGAILGSSVLMLGSTSVYAATITFTPGDCTVAAGCLSGDENNTPEILAAIEAVYPGLVELYKSDVGEFDTGAFAASYDTTYSNDPLDPMDAFIEWNTGSDTISCPNCFVLVKDGKQTPAWYLFDLDSWDGMDAISLQDFWPNQGAISHVSIMGAVVPVPAAIWLFGSGLLGLVGVARRKRA